MPESNQLTKKETTQQSTRTVYVLDMLTAFNLMGIGFFAAAAWFGSVWYTRNSGLIVLIAIAALGSLGLFLSFSLQKIRAVVDDSDNNNYDINIKEK